MRSSSTSASARPQINLTVDARTLTFVERKPRELELTGAWKSFRIVYPDVEIVLWVIGELSGPQAFNVLQQTIREIRFGVE